VVLVASLVALLAGCTNQPLSVEPGRAGPFNRFVSMAPSNTELLYAIGADKNLVAVCTQCDYPAAAKSLPKVGNFVTADMEKFATVRPDGVFLVNQQEPVAQMLQKQQAFRTVPIILHNDKIDDIADNTTTLGSLTGQSNQAQVVAAQFRDAVEQLSELTHRATTKPKVFFCVWPEPITAIGHDSYLNDAITICGGTNISGNVPGAYPRFNLEKLIVEQPDVIIMPAEADHSIASRAPWSSMQAVKNKRLYFLPDRDADRLSRPTLRTLEGLYWLAERIHPELSEQLSINKNSNRELFTRTTGH
jgi:iron complex transport system substrate-binding protein